VTDQRLRIRHSALILGFARRQVNEDRFLHAGINAAWEIQRLNIPEVLSVLDKRGDLNRSMQLIAERIGHGDDFRVADNPIRALEGNRYGVVAAISAPALRYEVSAPPIQFSTKR
jgi:hypothetical protein